jgi:hypothetical protein
MWLNQVDFIDSFSSLGDGFKICLFKNRLHESDAPSHFHFIIPLCNKRHLVVCVVTSQVEKLSVRYEYNQKSLDSMIPIYKKDFDYLNETKTTVVDCNQAVYFNITDLFESIDFSHKDGFQVKSFDNEIKSELKQEIIDGIINSPQVQQHIKDYINAQYLPKTPTHQPDIVV